MGRVLLEKVDEGALTEYSVPHVRSYTTGDAIVLEDGRIVDGPLGVVISGDLTVQGTLIAGAIPAGAGGSDTQAQYNNAGNLAGSSGLILSAAEVTAITLNSGLITGSGKIVLENDPVFLTRITSPELLGGSAVGSTLLLKSTSGVGSSDDIIANFTDLSTYANDAATIRNNMYQLSRKFKLLDDAVRAYGLLS